MDISHTYDVMLKTELEKRLKRPALPSEIANGDTDADLVNEVMWQLLCSLEQRLSALEKAV